MKNTILILFMIVMTMSQLATAQSVSSIKDSRALLDLGGGNFNVGDRIFAMDGQGKKKALMQIRQVKNGKAIADVLKGTAQPGMSLLRARAGSARSSGGAGRPSGTSNGLRTAQAYGFTAAVMMNSMKISNFVSGSTSYSFEMVGTNFGGSMFYDYPLTRDWFARGHGSLEMFDVKKTAAAPICKGGTSTDCNASFMQTGLYGTFNYVLKPAPFRIWVGGGGGALIYLSKESTVLDTSKFFFNTVMMAAVGADYFTSRNTFIPITFEYQMIPDKEAGVTSMVLRAGWGKTF